MVRPSVCLSVQFARCTPLLQVCCCGLCRQVMSIDCCTTHSSSHTAARQFLTGHASLRWLTCIMAVKRVVGVGVCICPCCVYNHNLYLNESMQTHVCKMAAIVGSATLSAGVRSWTHRTVMVAVIALSRYEVNAISVRLGKVVPQSLVKNCYTVPVTQWKHLCIEGQHCASVETVTHTHTPVLRPFLQDYPG